MIQRLDPATMFRHTHINDLKWSVDDINQYRIQFYIDRCPPICQSTKNEIVGSSMTTIIFSTTIVLFSLSHGRHLYN